MVKKIYLEIIISITLISICLIGLIFEVSSYSGSSAIMPYGVLILAIILSLVWLSQSLIKLKNNLDLINNLFADYSETKKFFKFVFIVLVYVIGISLIGFFTATIIVMPIISISMGYKNIKALFFTTILFTSFLFVVFKLFLKVPLPIEIWNRLLGV